MSSPWTYINKKNLSLSILTVQEFSGFTGASFFSILQRTDYGLVLFQREFVTNTDEGNEFFKLFFVSLWGHANLKKSPYPIARFLENLRFLQHLRLIRKSGASLLSPPPSFLLVRARAESEGEADMF